MAEKTNGSSIGDRFAPARFLVFVVFLAAGIPFLHPILGTWPQSAMGAFDAASFVFLASCVPLLNDSTDQMRSHAQANDAHRSVLLGVSVAVTIVILATVGSVITDSHALKMEDGAFVIGTLVLAWIFGNSVYALHYAHIYYSRDEDCDGDVGGIGFAGTKEPDYWDFIYFAFTLGMTFQTSDCEISSGRIRRVSLGHCMAAFVFNLGVLAFTINALGSSA